MARFNTASHRPKPPVALATSPIATLAEKPDTRTFEGAPGWTRNAKAELFLRATGAFHGGESTFYESAEKRDERLGELARTIALTDPQWGFEFACWLRGPGNMRTASLMFAIDFVKARLDAQQYGGVGVEVPHPDSAVVIATNRRIIDAVCQRADEPGELLAIWTAWYGRKIPKPVKRGAADAVRRLYSERSLLKYDTASHAYRFGDVLNLVHAQPHGQQPLVEIRVKRAVDHCPRDNVRALPTFAQARRYAEWTSRREGTAFRPNACACGWFHVTKKPKGVRVKGEVDRPTREGHSVPVYPASTQGNLFEFALDRRHHPSNDHDIPASLAVIQHNGWLREQAQLNPELLLDTDQLRNAGMTWEDALSLGGTLGVDKAKLWEAMIPSMGVMALIRNLRNFDQAGVSDQVAQQVVSKLTDPEVIAKSRQFPFRFLAAHRATKDAGSLRWAYPLEQALNHSLANVPVLGGRTLILVDRSPSMFPGYYQENSTDKRLGVSRADQAAIFGSALALRAEKPTLAEFGGESRIITVPTAGSVLPLVDTFTQIPYTDIAASLRQLYANHDRVIIITDEQSKPGYVAAMERNRWGTYSRAAEVSLDALVPLNVPVFMWNLAGYTASAMESGKNARFTLGGLTDSAFRLIPLLENGANGVWPWQLNIQGG